MQSIRKLLFSLVGAIFLAIPGLFAQEAAVPDTAFKSSEAIGSFFKAAKTRGTEASPKLSHLTLHLGIIFAQNDDALSERSKKQLDNLARVLLMSENQEEEIELAGHTSEEGEADYNQDLSFRRVQNAVQYLYTQHKIPLNRVSFRAYGESLPLFPGAKSDTLQALNRRVVAYRAKDRESIENLLSDIPFQNAFRWGLYRFDEQEKMELLDVENSLALHSGDEYRLFVQPAAPKFLYIFQADAAGKGAWLFPRQDLLLSNPLPPGAYFLPDLGSAYVLDQTVGTETIYIIASNKQIPELENMLTGATAAQFAAIVEDYPKTRGLKKVKIKPKPKRRKKKDEYRVVKTNQQSGNTSQQTGPAQVVEIMKTYQEFLLEVSFEHR